MRLKALKEDHAPQEKLRPRPQSCQGDKSRDNSESSNPTPMILGHSLFQWAESGEAFPKSTGNLSIMSGDKP